jgi:hypothetical protein
LDEKTAWNNFSHTGSIRDYLIYTQCKTKQNESEPQEDQHEDRRAGPGGYGEARG